MMIRPATAKDITDLSTVAEVAELFPGDMLPMMIAPALDGDESECWLVTEIDDNVVGFAFARLQEMTDNVWNILALAVHPNAQGNGYAKALINAAEERLDARMILIETTQLPQQDKARSLYTKLGYKQVATIPNYFSDGEDKVSFIKVMA